jgi:tRNA 2-selenouridine synthase
MPEVLNIDSFIDKFDKENPLLIDVRSEEEFDHAHIPNAINIPLLNNEHRHLTGIEYKKKGREAAVALGFKLVGPLFHEFINTANEKSKSKEAMIYCWRGGMRSSIMGWVLSMAGFKVTLLKGGYKSFRNFILEELKKKKEIIIIGGHTGVGKTEILSEIKNTGEQVIDLEKLANHRGSAFGRLGLPVQPSNEFFENQLGLLWRKVNQQKVVWLESESRNIGQIKIPDSVFEQLQNAPLVELTCDQEYRKKRILNEYGGFPKNDLAECTSRLGKRLGHLRLTEALTALENNQMNEWLEILIDYYDKTYSYSMNERKTTSRLSISKNENESIPELANRIIKESISLKVNV